jgi:hypothetical protein
LIFGGWACFLDEEEMGAFCDRRWLLGSQGPRVGIVDNSPSLSAEIREEEVQSVEDGVFDIHL